MAIKNKDGTVYRIEGPNPFMNNQELWSDCVKHNLEWKDEIVFDFLKQKLNLPVQDSAENFLEEIEQKPQEKPKQEPAPVFEKPPVPKKEKREFDTIESFCLPVDIIESRDDLYGEVKQKVIYGEVCTIEIVVLEQTDLTFRFWTTHKINKGSIIYPKNKDKRWWKVSEYTDAPKGFMYLALPSPFTPSFV
jgi:hypothetical protein